MNTAAIADTTTAVCRAARPQAHRQRGPVRFASRWLELLRIWLERDRSRRELASLDDATLRDIGISRAEARFIGDKPFWKA